MAPLRWGICATGLIAQDFCNALKLNPESHAIVAVGSRDAQKAREFATRFDIKHAFDSCEALATCDEVDIVYVASLTHLHYAHAKHYLQAGKHVLCEKPLTLVPAEAAELASLAQAANRFLMVAIWSRFFPSYARVRRAVAEGELGSVRLVQANFCQALPDVARLREKSLGGSVLSDFGVYLVSLASWVYAGEKPLSVTAAGHLDPSGVDISGTMILKYSGDRLATLVWSADVGPEATALVVGDKGIAKMGDMMWCTTKLTLNGELIHTPTPSAREGEKFNFHNSGGLLYEADHVKECLDKGLIESPLLPHSECQLIHDILAEGHRQLGVDFASS